MIIYHGIESDFTTQIIHRVMKDLSTSTSVEHNSTLGICVVYEGKPFAYNVTKNDNHTFMMTWQQVI